ncbi:AAA family ATPase [Heyndrickxia oleronia]|uniref:Shikimate kinase n=2 Tax=Heyndrickxia oleronia TaxID=38875 RepID=A0A8E2I6K3_9BACI|nr:AAA family ATPase [Heyndrickxia oleronia]MEC1377439.1 AAA family ATPase [Heyndrickxia oleronia]OOP67272.1 shikimate kinase [Heyndrickxia oleronia]
MGHEKNSSRKLRRSYKLVLIFGPQAVGKMTVGQELARITDLKLFHNHMTIDLVSHFFDYGTKEGKRLVGLFREEIFEEVSKSDLYGLIFTYVWAFDLQSDWDEVNKICNIFESKGGTVYFVELEANLEERLERNKSTNRLKHKPSKRNIEWSEKDLISSLKQYRLNSFDGEIQKDNYIKINNTNVSATEVAEIIANKFKL